jgi:hypothetical protein
MIAEQYELPLPGLELKEAGITAVTEHNADWLEDAVAIVAGFARQCPEFSSDEIRPLVVAQCGEPGHPNAWGGLLNSAAHRKYIAHAGYRKSTTPSAHARVVSVWRSL